MTLPTLGAVLALTAGLSAQNLTVDYDDSTIGTPATLGPFYTPGAGSAGLTVRGQYLCPSDFPGLPDVTMRCVAVGFQVQGAGTYSTFDLRAGVAGAPDLVPQWNVNLPDQTVQRSGTFTVATGPNPEWVEFPLNAPFLFNPGEAVCVDLTAFVQFPGPVLSPVPTSMDTPRNIEFSFFGQPVGNVRPTGGLKFRMVFEPVGLETFGQGCAASSNDPLTIQGVGVPATGSNVDVVLANGNALSPVVLFAGASNTTSAFGPLPFSYGAGCSIQTSLNLTFGATTDMSGVATFPVSIPADNNLVGATIHFQWAQTDAVAALFPFTSSNGLTSVVQ